MKRCTPGLIIFLLIIIWEFGWSYGLSSRKERDALKALYNKTGGRNWFHKENWKKAPGTEPTWYGITCDAANTTVLKIELRGNNLQGVLPTDMDAFSNLTTLDLSNNQLKGEIPRWLEKLKNLKKLDLNNNTFTGPIPPWIGNLKNLEELLLDNNMLDGAIPKELSKLRNLKVLKLGGNRLTGEIPAELVKLVNLEDNKSNFKWNSLYTRDVDLTDFLKRKQIDRDWESSQTIAPSDIKVVDFTEDTIKIGWKPITYTANTGGYQVFYRKEGQPYHDKSVEVVTAKTVTGVSLKELNKSTKYYFKIRTWTDSHRMNTNRIDSPLSKEFPAATGGIIISGTIRNKKNDEGIAGVQITGSNGGGTTYTDKDGKYKLSVISGWTGTVSPDKKGFKFSPLSMNYDKEVIKGISGNDYIAESDTLISGTIAYHGKGVGGVTLKFTGEDSDNYSVSTDENGNYKQEVFYNWSGSVTPIKDRHQFNPKEKKYKKVTSPHEGQNYEVQFPKIFGKVKNLRGKGISGVKLKFSNVETDKLKYLKDYTVTDEKGNYEIDVPEKWIGEVTPESYPKTKYFYYPPSRKIKNHEDIKKALNFKARRLFKFLISITGNFMLTSDYSDSNDIIIETYIYPEITMGFKFSRWLYVWSGFRFIAKRLNSDVFKEAKWPQESFSLGIGYVRNLVKTNTSSLDGRGEFGLVLFRYKEGTFTDKVSVKAWGVKWRSALIFNISDRWFTETPFELLFSKNYNIYGSIGFSLGYRF